MNELYNAISGSPITYLAGDISAGQTTIAIADDTALPDAPNICTIGYGEHIETIKYEAKSNGVLQNVTRGIEGTPRAWPSGTEVARFFTACDHNAIIEAHKAHQAENSNKHIKESGSNENGHYIKFDNGVMICFAQVAINRSSDYLNQEQNFSFPQPFVSVPAVSLSHVWGASSAYQESNATIFISASDTRWRFAITKSTSVGSTLGAYAIAIGRWK